MQPFYFGPERQLFGVYDPPVQDTGRSAGVVLCHPYGQDYMYAFRPYRTLAMRLARAGFHVLRFDYAGTGDSSGDVDRASVSQWVADIIAAIDQLRSFGQTSVSLVGFRLGATLAAAAAAESGRVARVVLWEPVVHGPAYVASLQTRHREWFQDLVSQVPGSRRFEREDDLLGLRFTERFRRDLERLSLESLSTSPARDVLLISSQHGDSSYSQLAECLRSFGANVDVKTVEDLKIWSMVPGMQLGLVPSRLLLEIDNWLRGSLA
jgi:pimeloyl-ACP methyl ester carboxylesterase